MFYMFNMLHNVRDSCTNIGNFVKDNLFKDAMEYAAESKNAEVSKYIKKTS